MKAAFLILAALLLAAADAPNQNSTQRNGVIHPGANVDPGMKVVPPDTRTRTPVINPPGRPHVDRRHDLTVVPK